MMSVISCFWGKTPWSDRDTNMNIDCSPVSVPRSVASYGCGPECLTYCSVRKQYANMQICHPIQVFPGHTSGLNLAVAYSKS